MIKKIALGVALSAVLVMTGGAGGGCSSILGKAASPNESVLGDTLVDDKALYAAEAAFYGANTAAEAAVDSGLLVKGSPTALQVKSGLQTAHTALPAARAAYKAGDAKTYGDKVAAVQATVAEAWKLIPRKET